MMDPDMSSIDHERIKLLASKVKELEARLEEVSCATEESIIKSWIDNTIHRSNSMIKETFRVNTETTIRKSLDEYNNQMKEFVYKQLGKKLDATDCYNRVEIDKLLERDEETYYNKREINQLLYQKMNKSDLLYTKENQREVIGEMINKKMVSLQEQIHKINSALLASNNGAPKIQIARNNPPATIIKEKEIVVKERTKQEPCKCKCVCSAKETNSRINDFKKQYKDDFQMLRQKQAIDTKNTCQSIYSLSEMVNNVKEHADRSLHLLMENLSDVKKANLTTVEEEIKGHEQTMGMIQKLERRIQEISSELKEIESSMLMRPDFSDIHRILNTRPA